MLIINIKSIYLINNYFKYLFLLLKKYYLSRNIIKINYRFNNIKNFKKNNENIKIINKNIFIYFKYYKNTKNNSFLNFIYEDNFLFLINKKNNIILHPGVKNKTNTILNIILNLNNKLITVPRGGIIHRLDKNTTGIIIITKTKISFIILKKFLNEFKIKRYYIALVWGDIKKYGKINKKIKNKFRNKIKNIKNNEYDSETFFYKIKEGLIKKKKVSLLNLELKTGRTHQIRLHMKLINNPLIGEKIYIKQECKLFPYQALQAWKICFEHPIFKKKITFNIPISKNFCKLLILSNINFLNFYN